MEQDVEQGYSTVCATCLSTDRDLFSLAALPQIYEIFRWIMYDSAAGALDADLTQLICWECLAMFKKVNRFKWQVHNAQDSLRMLALSQHEAMDHTYISQSLSSLVVESKTDYDKIFFDYSSAPECVQFVTVANIEGGTDRYQSMDDIGMDMDERMMEVPEIVLENSSTGVLSHIVVDTSTFIKSEANGSMPQLTIEPLKLSSHSDPLSQPAVVPKKEKPPKPRYRVEYMSEADMLATRETAKTKVQYASSVYKCELCIIGFYTQQQVEQHFETAHRAVYKCELCIIGFYTQQQVEQHFETAHRAKPGYESCKVCYVNVPEDKLSSHTDGHYARYVCKLCGKIEYSERLIEIHVDAHMVRSAPAHLIHIEGGKTGKGQKDKKKNSQPTEPPQPGDLRKLLSKTTIEGYKCLECDMFFKTSRARKNHVARFHREGLQCDHCKKRFVNKTTLATHLRLHEGPLPREECPICHKMVRSIQIKYHIQRHQNKGRYECVECNKVFSHMATYHAHLKYSRAHASDQVFKFPCPMCNKGYPTKEQMQDHFNYQHLGKTSHKCPICSKPIASRANVEKHIARVHAEKKKEKPRNHVCQICGKPFTDRKALSQHEVIHSGARPLSCDICQQTFKQKASLYTHRKRVHKVFPQKKEVQYMNEPPVSNWKSEST